MKRRLISMICTALCLCYTASLCCGCARMFPDLALPVAAETPTSPLADHLTEALAREEETIDISPYRAEEAEVHAVYSTLYATDPSLFYIAAEYSLSCAADNTVAYLRPVYRLSGEARIRAAEDFTRRVKSVTAPVRALSRLEQVAYLHDYMVLHFTYDTDHAVYDAYSLLTGGSGVCQAYALLFTALARELKIPTVCVPCFDRAHEWNAVYLNDEWHHIDLVWDDTDTAGEIRHTYFLIGDEELRASRAAQDAAWHTAYTWDAPAPAPGTATRNAPWRELKTPFAFPADGTLTFSLSGRCYVLLPDLSCRETSTETTQ